MPSISPQVRAQVGGSSESVFPRASQKASTGMNMPPLSAPDAQAPQKTGQPTTNEETPAQAVTLSAPLTALARKQQKLQSEIQAQRDKEAAFEASKADYVPKSAFKAKLQQNAAEALSEIGITYEELTEALLAQQNGEDPVKRLESRLDKITKTQEESTNKLFDATVNQYKAEAKKLVDTSDKYLALREEMGDQSSEAMQGIIAEFLEDWEKTGEVKDISFYLDLAEDGLRDQAKKYKAFLDKIEKPQTEETPAAKKTLPPPNAAPKTLTRQVETTPTRTYNQFQHLSMKERIAQAIARAQK